MSAHNDAHSRFDGGAPEIRVAYAVVGEILPAADLVAGVSPAWFGWALREAYLRGVLAERERCARAVAEPFRAENADEGAAVCPQCERHYARLAADIGESIRRGVQ